MLHKYKTLTSLQQIALQKNFIGIFTNAIVIITIVKVFYLTFSADILLIRNYVSGAPLLLIFIPFIKRFVKNNPIPCYRIKGVLMVGGVLFLMVVEIFSLPKELYLVDFAIVCTMPLLTMTHSTYVSSRVANNCKEYSEVCGYMQVLSNIINIVLGITLVYLDLPIGVVLVGLLVTECLVRRLELQIANAVFISETDTVTN